MTGGLLISAAGKSSGKTAFTAGLLAAWKRRGIDVRPFKKGPDYIDPKWLSRAAGCDCYNLDFNTQSCDEMQAMYRHRRQNGVGVVEANKGLHDGLSPDGSDSNAALAKLLHLPVVLVIDCEGITRGVAPLLQGYRRFDEAVEIAGVVLNKVGGSRHESKLRAAVDEYVGLPVLAAVMKEARMGLPERHLGLMPANEMAAADDVVEAMAAAVEEQADLDALLRIARQTAPLNEGALGETSSDARMLDEGALPDEAAVGEAAGPSFRLGVFRDAAFGFYYPDDLEALQRSGAELMFIDSLNETHLPDVDALFIGGGFPETCAVALEANRDLRRAVYDAVESGMPAYAECGGLMYLSRSIAWHGQRYQMAGVLPMDVVMHAKPRGRGYVRIRETEAMPWPRVGDCGPEYAAHEFHYSEIAELPQTLPTAFKVLRGTGLGDGTDGIVYKNLLASYTHQRTTRSNPWAYRFARFVGGVHMSG